jgi:hypothetical protein
VLKALVFRNCRRDTGAGVFGTEENDGIPIEIPLQTELLQ